MFRILNLFLIFSFSVALDSLSSRRLDSGVEPLILQEKNTYIRDALKFGHKNSAVPRALERVSERIEESERTSERYDRTNKRMSGRASGPVLTF